MALSDSTQADRPNSAVCCMVCLSGFVKQCSLNVDSLMDFISACLLAEGSNLPPPGLAQMSSEVAAWRTTLISVRAAPRAASGALRQEQASSAIPHPQHSVGSGWWMHVVICPLIFSLGRNGPWAPLYAQRCVGLHRVFFQITMQVNCLGLLSRELRECYAKTCLCFPLYACETCGCVECLMTLQVQFPLGNNVCDFVTVTARLVEQHMKYNLIKVNNS